MDSDEFRSLLTAEEFKDLVKLGRRVNYRRGEPIFRQSESSESIVVVLAGRVKVSCDTENGSEVILAVRGPGTLLGELSALDAQPRSATVTTLEEVSVLIVPGPAFAAYLQTHARVTYLLLRMLTGRLRDADRKRIEFGAHSATDRVAARLVELAERFGRPAVGGVRITIPLSQDELAGWTGASREAVSKALRVLREAGCVSTGRRSITVLDLEALRDRVAGR
jgi:CRP/FNR family transcriptional regulator, cyclic AMP receptor protein